MNSLSKKDIKKEKIPVKANSETHSKSMTISTVYKRFIPIFITFLFTVRVSIGMIYHELWRDELEIYSRIALTNNVLMEGDVSFIQR